MNSASVTPLEELKGLRCEVEVLRASAAAQEAHLLAVTAEMDAMLHAVEKQRNELAKTLANAASTNGLLDRIIETAEDLIVFADARGKIRRVNRQRAAQIGFDPAALIDESLDSLIAEEDLAALISRRPVQTPDVRGLLCEMVCASGRFSEELHFRLDGSARRGIWQLRASVVVTPQGKIDGVVAIFTDITAWREAETEMRLAANVFDSTTEGIMVTDINGVILSVNPAFTQITGFSAEEAIGQTPRLLKSEHHDEAFYKAMWQELIDKGSWRGDVWNRRRNGELFLKRGTISMIPDANGKPSRYVSLFNDYTEIWHKDEHTRHLAFHDALTGLANRALLEERLEHAIALARREERQLALLFLDLDGFKPVNDTYGHDVGDQLLKIIAERLKSLLRTTDTVARLGGDEFVLLLESPPVNRESQMAIAARIVASLGQAVDLCGHSIKVGASIGVAIFPLHGEDAATLMGNADAAMYAAKAAGKNTFRFVDRFAAPFVE